MRVIMLLSELSVVFIAIAKHFLAGSVAVNWKFARQRQVHQHLFIPYPAPREELRSRRLGCGPWRLLSLVRESKVIGARLRGIHRVHPARGTRIQHVLGWMREISQRRHRVIVYSTPVIHHSVRRTRLAWSNDIRIQ
jgi:hypothetical protein